MPTASSTELPVGEGWRPGNLSGVRVVELADEPAEYCGLLLAGLGAAVIKVEPPGGSPTRKIGPFLNGSGDPEESLFFWHYNRGKRSVVLDLGDADGVGGLRRLLQTADVLLESTEHGQLERLGLGPRDLADEFPGLVVARMSPFGDDGPWASWTGSDLVHLALGGPVMNCGYDPRPDGAYDLPPIAPQMWHSAHIAGEQLAMFVIGALVHRQRSGSGQTVTCAMHEAISKSTELDLPSWIMRAAPLRRQTCRHAAETVSPVPTLLRTKDGRWLAFMLMTPRDADRVGAFVQSYGIESGLAPHTTVQDATAESAARNVPGSLDSELRGRCTEAMQRLFGRFLYDDAPWAEAQVAGLMVAPLRRPHENALDPHWQQRGTFAAVEHPELDRTFTYPVSKWVSSETAWQVGRRAPRLGEDAELLVSADGAPATRRDLRGVGTGPAPTRWALDGVRVLDFGWFLASAGGTRFVAAMGAECIKVEWRAHPDTRLGAMAPIGGREARRAATGPLEPVNDPDMGGNFHHKNAGKRGISLNVADPRGLEIARRLVAVSDVVAEGFSPGVLERWGLGYDRLRAIRPDIIYVQQSGTGSQGSYGRVRTVGPVAAALAGTSEMSGLPEPFAPAGWGYSYLDWMGAYGFCLAVVSAIYYRNETGRGQWIDASQCEAGIYATGTAVLDWSANGTVWRRTGNESPYKPAAPHGIYRTAGEDHWLALACFTDEQWASVCRVAARPDWQADDRFKTLDDRIRFRQDLDREVAGWLGGVESRDLMSRLQAAGVPAGACQTAADRCERDPQLAHLSWLREVPGSKIGTWPMPDVPVRMSGTPAQVGGKLGRGGPIYGEDNEYVYGELLGMSSRAIAELRDDGVI